MTYIYSRLPELVEEFDGIKSLQIFIHSAVVAVVSILGWKPIPQHKPIGAQEKMPPLMWRLEKRMRYLGQSANSVNLNRSRRLVSKLAEIIRPNKQF